MTALVKSEQKAMMQVMAERFGIPASQIGRPEVVAVLANAMQRQEQYGWQPGVHMHVQRYETEESRSRNLPPDQKVYNYVLVDGEKAWKESFIRWRTEYGVRWRFQRRTMTPDELEAEIKLMGFSEKTPGHAYGVWSRIVIDGEDDPEDPDNPMWASGIWFGKLKVGKWWRDDALPTGNSSRDVAVRRADKRAMMQSSLGLIPLDNRSHEERRASLAMLAAQAEPIEPRRLPARAALPAPPAPVEDDIIDGEIVDDVDVVGDDVVGADLTQDLDFYAAAFSDPARDFGGQEVSSYVVAMRVRDKESDRPMSEKGYEAVVDAINGALGMDGQLVLSTLLGRPVTPDERPGVGVKDIYNHARYSEYAEHKMLESVAHVAMGIYAELRG